jgi:hypothetical protein
MLRAALLLTHTVVWKMGCAFNHQILLSIALSVDSDNIRHREGELQVV